MRLEVGEIGKDGVREKKKRRGGGYNMRIEDDKSFKILFAFVH